MDFKDDFEFKPLSQGLGFHPRNQQLRTGSEEQSDFEVPAKPASTLKKSKKLADDNVFTIDESITLDQMPQFQTTPSTPAPTSKKMGLSFLEDTARDSGRDSGGESSTSKVSSLLKGFQKESMPAPSAVSPSSQTAKQAVDDILKTLKDKNKGLEAKMTPGAGTKAKAKVTNTSTTASTTMSTQEAAANALLMKGYRASEMSWGAAFLDALLIFAASLLCMIILLTITRVDLLKAISTSSDREIYFALMGLFALVNFLYMTVHRVFLGQTPGEWAFDQRLGTVHEQFQLGYIFKSAFRTVLNIATGFIIFPLISFAMGRDVLADATGLQLYQKN